VLTASFPNGTAAIFFIWRLIRPPAVSDETLIRCAGLQVFAIPSLFPTSDVPDF